MGFSLVRELLLLLQLQLFCIYLTYFSVLVLFGMMMTWVEVKWWSEDSSGGPNFVGVRQSSCGLCYRIIKQSKD